MSTLQTLAVAGVLTAGAASVAAQTPAIPLFPGVTALAVEEARHDRAEPDPVRS